MTEPKVQPRYPWLQREDASGLPLPTPLEEPHQFTARCLQHQKLAKRYPNPKDRAHYARLRYTKKDEDAYREGHTEEMERESQNASWRVPPTDLYVPQTSATRGGDPVLTDAEARAVAKRMGGLPAEETQATRGLRTATGLKAVVEKGIGLEQQIKMAKEGGEAKVGKAMGEFKRGTLKSGSGQKVTDRDQALAIAMSEAGLSRSRKH